MEITAPQNLSENPSEILKELVRKKRVPAGKLLELNCGSGADSLYLAAKKFKVTGIDSSVIMINYAKHKDAKKRCHFQQMQGLPLQFSSRSFDAVLDNGFFSSLDKKDNEQYMKEVYRVLNVNGILILLSQSRDVEKFDLKSLLQKNKLIDIKGLFSSHFELQEMLEKNEENLLTTAYLLKKK